MVSAIYLPFFMTMTLIAGHLLQLGSESLFFGSYDAQGYKQLADYYTSLGNSQRPSDFLLKVRPFLFPLFLGLYRVVGIAGVQLLQILLNVASLWLLFVAIKSFSGRSWIAGICTTVLALTPTFNFIAFHALTETFSIFLICVFVVCIVDHFQEDQPASLYMAAFVISLLLCVKPVVMPIWLLLIAYCGIRWLGEKRRTVWQPLLIATPVVSQLVISSIVTGSGTVASFGAVGLSAWYFPGVYGEKEYGRFVGSDTPEGQEGLRRYPELKDKLAYLASNYDVAIKTYVSLLIGQHMLAGSNFVRDGIPITEQNEQVLLSLQKYSRRLGRLFTFLHAIMFALIALTVVSGTSMNVKRTMLVCYLFAVLLILPLPLAYWQGDRYIFLLEPLWLVAYGSLVSLLITQWSERWGAVVLRGSEEGVHGESKR